VHVLTKVFMVLAAVATIALSSLVIAYAVNTDRIRSDYTAQLNRAAVAGAMRESELAVNSREQARLSAQVEDAQRRVRELEERNAALENERGTLMAAKSNAEAERASTIAKIAELGETVRTQATLIAAYRDEAQTLRGNELDIRNRSLDMEQRLSDLTSQREVLEQNYRALQEELAELKRDASTRVSGATAAATDTNAGFVASGPVIQGRVLDVQTDPTSGKSLVRLSVGTNNRVAEGMQFYAARDGATLVGTLVVIRADLSESVAEVRLLRKEAGEVRAGDVVLSRL
jgi:TolA-binding protein